jgi:protein involved in polysaccharide export with SLBB domain
MEFAVIGASRVTGHPSTLRPSSTIILIFFFVLAVATSQSAAQTVQPTAEQQQMLNQLPPAQRQQALQALEQLNRRGSGGTQQSSIAEQLSPLPQAAQPLPAEFLATLEEPEAQGDSRLIIDLNPKPDLSPQETTMLQDDAALQRIQGSHYYELNESGVLLLPGLSKIPLLGLTAEAIEQRLGAEPSLKIFNVSVSILDEKPIGADALKPFGYDLFESKSYGFEPVTTGPVPPDYVLGPGDSIRVQLFGNVNGIYEFEVTRDGILNLPEIGPVTVAGLPFSEFRADLKRRVQEMLIGTQVSVTIGQLRSIRIFVLGDANRPGSYVVSSLATMGSALYRSGGISPIGTLRNIQLKRQGKLVATLDLYDLLLHGDTSGDLRLQPGDVLFIPPGYLG